jgi:hypothetical protein
MKPASSEAADRKIRQSYRHNWLQAVGRDAHFAKNPSAVRTAIMIWNRWFVGTNDAAVSLSQLAQMLAGIRSMETDPVKRAEQEKLFATHRPTAVRALKALTARGWLRLSGHRGRRGENRYELAGGPDNLPLARPPKVTDSTDLPALTRNGGGSSRATT